MFSRASYHATRQGGVGRATCCPAGRGCARRRARQPARRAPGTRTFQSKCNPRSGLKINVPQMNIPTAQIDHWAIGPNAKTRAGVPARVDVVLTPSIIGSKLRHRRSWSSKPVASESECNCGGLPGQIADAPMANRIERVSILAGGLWNADKDRIYSQCNDGKD